MSFKSGWPGRGISSFWFFFLFFSWIILRVYPVYAQDTLVIGVGRDFYEGPDSRTRLHGSTNTWEALVYLDADMKAVPWLAESWQADPDELTWRFTLRPGVRFHDGSLMTAGDAAASIERIRRHPRFDPAGSYGEVVSVSAEGERQVVFRLKTRVPDFPKRTAYYSSPVFKPDGFDAEGRINKFIATGPYRPERVVPGSEIRLAPFEDYWGNPPAYRRVVFKKISDAQTRVMALMSGDIDAVADVGGILPQQADMIKSVPGLVLKRVEVATTHILLFNCGRPPFSDVKLRVWLAGAIDREKLVETFAGGAGRMAADPYTRLCADYAFGLIRPASPPFPEKKTKNSEEAVLVLHGGTLERWPYLEIAQVVQQNLSSKGLKSRIDIREPGAYHEAIKTGAFDLAVQPYTLMTGDPDFFYAYFIASDAPRNPGYHNAEADGLIRSARREADIGNRKAAYRSLSEILNRDLPLLPLYHDVSLYACRDAVSGFRMDHFFKPILTRGDLCP